MPLSQQDLIQKPGESIDAYNARISILRGDPIGNTMIGGSSPARVEEEKQRMLRVGVERQRLLKEMGLPADPNVSITTDVRPIVQPDGTITRPISDTAPFPGQQQPAQQQQPQPAQQQVQQQIPAGELPYQTYERTTGKKWTGGLSPEVQSLYKQFGITAPAGSAQANLALQKALASQPTTDTSKKPATGQPKTDTAQPTLQPPPKIGDTAASTGFNDIFAQFGLSTQNKIEDIVKTVSQMYGFESINKEMEKMDNQYADDVMSVNSNPWLSEAARQKKVSLLQDKYENKKNALVDRLRLSESLVGRAIDTYYKERQFQQNQIEMALNLRNREIEKQDRQIQQDFENQLAMEKFELEKIKREDKIKIIKPEEYNKLLSVDEATKFGVPFGTTRGEVVGKVPAAISQLGIEATKTRENAISGLGALKVVEDEINKDMKILLKAAAPGAIFARKFETARKEASDVITRLRTGAALNESEERFYKSQLPSILDYGNKEAINYKIELFRSLFERLQKSSPIQSFQSQNNDPLGIR